MRIGRNDPCICGSKKKYKYCCLLKAQGYIKEADGKLYKILPREVEVSKPIGSEDFAMASKEEFHPT